MLLLVLTLGFLFAEHVVVSVEVSEAKPAVVLVNSLKKASPDIAKALPDASTATSGPGGQQPWVRWSYIP